MLSNSSSVSPSACSCVTESVTPQQEVKEGELEAGRKRWREGEGAKVRNRIMPDSMKGANAEMCDTSKKDDEGSKLCLCARRCTCDGAPISSNYCMNVRSVLLLICLFVCVCVCTQWRWFGGGQAGAAGEAFLCSPVIHK